MNIEAAETKPNTQKTKERLHEASTRKLLEKFNKKYEEYDSVYYSQELTESMKLKKIKEIEERFGIEINEILKSCKLLDEMDESVFWNADNLIEYIEKNFIKIEENKEYLWYKWKILSIKLPMIWNFNWYTFKCFISDDSYSSEEVNKNPKIEKECFQKKEMDELSKSIKTYISECWFKKNRLYIYDIWNHMWAYWLKDYNKENSKRSRWLRDNWSIDRFKSNEPYTWKLLLKYEK